MAIVALEKSFSSYEIVYSCILMSKLTWITGKELQREIKKETNFVERKT